MSTTFSDNVSHLDEVDFNLNPVHNIVVETVTSLPTACKVGQFVFLESATEPALNDMYYYNGTIWDRCGDSGGGSLPSGELNQTLRHNGTDWVASENLMVSESIHYESDYSVKGIGNSFQIAISDYDENNFSSSLTTSVQSGYSDGVVDTSSHSYTELTSFKQTSENNGIISGVSSLVLTQGVSSSVGDGISLFIQKFGGTPSFTGIQLNGDTQSIEIQGITFKINYLAGTGYRPLFAAPDGSITTQSA